MVLAIWLRSLRSKLKVHPGSRINGSPFQSEAQFRAEVARERVRTDRSGLPFAILVIDLPSDRSTEHDFQFLGHVLTQRLRITDTVGLVTGHRVCVLLPDTSESGAWKVASDVCDFYPVGHDRPNCEVFVYPTHLRGRGDGVPMQNGESAGRAAALNIDTLLACNIPTSKRILDVLGASIGIALTAPPLVVIAAVIKLTSRGPVLYSQEREGLGGRRFRMFKLRTMQPDAEQHQESLRALSVQDGPAFKLAYDPRTTWLGRLLRRASLDELPQLWNVLRGDMSLVGPRPLPTCESLQCEPWQRRRLTVTPGLTCIWQVWGRSTVSFDEWMRMDLQYVQRRSFGYDLRLLLKTAPAILFSQGPR